MGLRSARVLLLLTVALASAGVSSAQDKLAPEWPPKASTIFISFAVPTVHMTRSPSFEGTVLGALAGPSLDNIVEHAQPALPLDRLVCENTA